MFARNRVFSDGSWHRLGLVSVATLTALSLVAACGGRTGDEAGTGGVGPGGASPVAGGQLGAPGGTSFGGASSGGASQGKGGAAAGGGCSFEGRSYATGDSFPAGDGCNTCTCYGMNNVSCTFVICPNTCGAIRDDYGITLDEAKRCDPTLDSEQCTALEPGELYCRCPSFVNPAMGAAREQLAKLRDAYDLKSCNDNILCVECIAPSRGVCGREGLCVDVDDRGRASCLVNGTLYAHGARGIKDPTSCNTCGCDNGTLTCTEIGCEQPCPPDSKAGRRCALCGPADGCAIVETGCLPLCVESCPSAGDSCINHVCTARCG